MKRIQYSTTLREDLLKEFKVKCKEDNIGMNEVLESFMQLYLEDKIRFERKVYVTT